MRTFFKNHWKDIGQLVGFVAACMLLVWVAGYLGLAVTLTVALLLCIFTGLSERLMKVVACGVLLPVIFLAFIQVHEMSGKIKLKFPETPNTPLARKPKTEADRLRTVEIKVESAARNIATLSDTFDKFLQEGKDELPTEPKTYGPAKIPEPVIKWGPGSPEAPMEPESEDTEPKLPKGNVLPNISKPEDLPPEILVQVGKWQEPTQEAEEEANCVLGSCGRVHRITGWTADGRAQYGPCRDIVGLPACSFVRFGVVKWK